MGRIAGHYEWDNDDLRPGRKSEGGLHQNLFDSDGALQGSARFVPDEGSQGEPLVITETIYVPVEQRRRSAEEEELNRAIADLLVKVISVGVAKAKPYVESWWHSSARPAIENQRAKVLARRDRRKAAGQVAEIEEHVALPAGESERLPVVLAPEMSRAEAQSRVLAAIAAQAYAEEQMRLVASSMIVEGDSYDELRASIAALPSGEVQALLLKMVSDPSRLRDENLAEVASTLGLLDGGFRSRAPSVVQALGRKRHIS